jgi:acetyltransferase-like isoleucine patch superfamily enzyme
MNSVVARLNRSFRTRLDLAVMKGRGVVTRMAGFGVMEIGPGLLKGRGVRLVVYGRLSIGRNVILSDGCALEIGPHGHLTLGEGAFVGRGTVIRSDESITIGRHCMVAEHCSIRDQDHVADPDLRRHETASVTSPIHLGEHVWVGAGARILRGSELGDGAVVAANAVVRSQFPPGVVVAGVPARVVKTFSAVPAPSESAAVQPQR